MSFRRQKSSFTDPDNSNGEEGWIWGNSRGGGGAPLRDASGNTVTNLKQIVNVQEGHQSRRDYSPPMYDSPKKKGPRNNVPPLRRNDYDDDDYYEEPRGRRGGGGPDYGGNNRRIPGLDDPYREPAAHGSVSPQGSPKKFMSAIQEMNNSSSMQEKMARQK